jgi:hypothetical protein
MKGKNRFFVKGFYMMIAVMTMFLVGAADRACAATGSVVIPVAEFTDDGFGGSYTKSFSGGYLGGADDSPCLVAPVKIPGNATKINKLIVYLTDDGTGAFDPLFQLTAIDMTTAFAEDYVKGEVADGSDTIQAIEVPLLKQKLVKGRVYQLGTCLANGQYLYGVKVLYTVP